MAKKRRKNEKAKRTEYARSLQELRLAYMELSCAEEDESAHYRRHHMETGAFGSIRRVSSPFEVGEEDDRGE